MKEHGVTTLSMRRLDSRAVAEDNPPALREEEVEGEEGYTTGKEKRAKRGEEMSRGRGGERKEDAEAGRERGGKGTRRSPFA